MVQVVGSDFFGDPARPTISKSIFIDPHPAGYVFDKRALINGVVLHLTAQDRSEVGIFGRPANVNLEVLPRDQQSGRNLHMEPEQAYELGQALCQAAVKAGYTLPTSEDGR